MQSKALFRSVDFKLNLCLVSNFLYQHQSLKTFFFQSANHNVKEIVICWNVRDVSFQKVLFSGATPPSKNETEHGIFSLPIKKNLCQICIDMLYNTIVESCDAY